MLTRCRSCVLSIMHATVSNFPAQISFILHLCSAGLVPFICGRYVCNDQVMLLFRFLFSLIPLCSIHTFFHDRLCTQRSAIFLLKSLFILHLCSAGLVLLICGRCACNDQVMLLFRFLFSLIPLCSIHTFFHDRLCTQWSAIFLLKSLLFCIYVPLG